MTQQVNLEKAGELKYTLTVSVPWEEISPVYEKELKKIASKISIKGFRPGKVPTKLVENNYMDSVLAEVEKEVFSESFDALTKEHELNVAGYPDIKPSSEWKKGEAFTYGGTFEVYPQFSLKDLTGETLSQYTASVTDDDVEEALMKIRIERADWVDADRPIRKGDRVEMTTESTLDGERVDVLTNEEPMKIEVGLEENLFKTIDEALLSKQVGDEATCDIHLTAGDVKQKSWPESLSDKTVHMKMNIRSVQMPQLAELNDQFAKQLGCEDGVDALRQRLREEMEETLKDRLEDRNKQEIFDRLKALNPISIPESLVQLEMQQLGRAMQSRMMNLYARYNRGQMPKRLPDINLEMHRGEAIERVTLGLIVAEAVKQFGLTVDEDRLDQLIDDYSVQFNDPAAAREQILKNESILSDMRAKVVEDQVVEKLKEQATLEEETLTFDQAIKPKPSLAVGEPPESAERSVD